MLGTTKFSQVYVIVCTLSEVYRINKKKRNTIHETMIVDGLILMGTFFYFKYIPSTFNI